MFLSACGTNTQPTNITISENSTETWVEKIKVSASLVPLASILNVIGWEYVEVNTIIPPGVSPHWFDVSPRQVQSIADSEAVFIVWWLWIDDFLEKIDISANIIPLSTWLALLSAEEHEHEDEHSDEDEEHSEDEHEEDEHEDEDEHSDEAHSIDPHVWLGQENILKITDTLRTELSSILPEQAEYFASNTEIFKNDLDGVISDFVEQNTNLEVKEFIVFHDAYNYLFESVWIDNDKKIVFSPNSLQEIGTAHLAEIIDEIEIHWVENIFSEPQFASDTLDSFVEKYSLSVATLDPIGKDDSADGYINNLKSNLEQLQSIYE